MAKINILPPKVYNRIAAGEVVERPCSVVKELVENAIDAGATEIEIHIEQGGKQLIRVIDNGCGIERDDLQSAFLPHATSKIAKAEDLENILTLGFRGEAIASIASVSKMTIASKTENGKCYSLSSNGGELGQITECSGEKGTEVSVEMLFFNAPVRLNFLKTDKGEETEVTNFISRFILNRSDIAFTYYANGKKILQSFGGGDEEALVSVYGAATLRECYQIDAEKHGVRVRGYIGNQNFYKANKTYQSTFLNGRYIVNATVSSAISNAYASYLMKRQYPFYVLHIEVPTEVVDVNVHPNKADVRFASNQVIYGCIYSIISAVLDGHTKALDYVLQQPVETQLDNQSAFTQLSMEKEEPIKPLGKVPVLKEKSEEEKGGNSFGFATFGYEEAQKEIKACAPAFTKSSGGMSVPFGEESEPIKGFIPNGQLGDYVHKEHLKLREPSKMPDVLPAEKLHEHFPDLYFKRNVLEVDNPRNENKIELDSQRDFFAENKKFLAELEEKERKAKQGKIEVSDCTYAGKLFNTYLLYERQNEVYIIDQHAAHERLIFDKLKEKMQNRTVVRQPMIFPFSMQLNGFECEFMRDYSPQLAEIGFELSTTEENILEIYTIPSDLQRIDLRSFVNDLLGYVSNYRAIKLEDLLKDKLAAAACKAAVKGGMDLSREEINVLFEMMDGNMGLKCPHGRPVVVKMTRVQLEKMFKRIV